MKRFISGALVGTILTSGIVLAANYTATENPFPIKMDNKNVSLEGYNIEGSTYFKLRDIADVVGGFDVDFKDNTIVLTSEKSKTPEAAANSDKYSRTNPAPINTVQQYTRTSDWLDKDNYTVSIRVMDVVRGEKAYAALKSKSKAYPEADEGYEYVNVKIAFSVNSTKTDIAINPSQGYFTAFTSNNEECPANYYASIDPVLTGSLYSGGNAEGWITVMVKKDDAKPKIAYGLDYNGANGVWFALYE